jgi:hypothetical protein
VAKAVRFDLIADSSKFTRGMRDAQRSSEKFTQHTSNAGKALKAAVGAFSVGVVVSQMRNWVAAARDSNKTAAQTATVLKSTHNAAGLTADQFAALATEISKTAAIDDDLVQSGENIIATFTNIHGDVFKKTTQAAVDMTAAMNHGEVSQEALKGTSILLGKALNDPTKGLSALTRVGVTFTQQQKDQIAGFIKHGQVAKAQGVILAEVNKEFGGSAAAAVTPAKQLAVTWGNMQEVLGNLLIPAIDRGAQILNSILGVVDENRTAFGVLFGVLGSGAAIVGTLIVAEKIHAAVTDSIKVATAAWGAAQKGLNLVLGTTRAQAVAASIAEEGLAASTTAAGAAATGASAAIGTRGLSSSTSGFVQQGVAAIPVLGALTAGFVLSMKASKDHVSTWDELRHSLGFGVEKLDKAKDASDRTAAAQAKLAMDAQAAGVAQGQLAGKTDVQAAAMVNNAAKAKELSGKLAELKDQFKQQVDAVKQSIQSYDGLISKSKTTAAEVIKDIRNQTSNFKTYSHDVHRLIAAGVSPAAIQELSQKGPQYVHALATGSNAQLKTYRQYWRDRQAEVKGGFAKSMEEQFQGLVRKMRAMQREINKLKGKTVDVTASTKVDPNVLKVFTAAGGKVRMSQKGDRVPGYGGGDRHPYLLEGGETVVSKEHSRLPVMRAAFTAAGVPGFAAGGAVYSAELGMRNRASGLMVGSASRAAKLMQQMAGLGGPGGRPPKGVIQQFAAMLLAGRGWGGQWGSFNALEMGEAGWNPFAQNPASTAYGLGQFLNGTWATVGGHKTSDYRLQLEYMMRYIGRNYDSPANAYRKWLGRSPHWYDQGGFLPPGLSLAYNGTGRGEPVGIDYDKLGRAVAKALREMPPTVAVTDIHAGLLNQKRRTGGVALGLS